jgi:hypothetical protein
MKSKRRREKVPLAPPPPPPPQADIKRAARFRSERSEPARSIRRSNVPRQRHRVHRQVHRDAG